MLKGSPCLVGAAGGVAGGRCLTALRVAHTTDVPFVTAGGLVFTGEHR